MNAQSRSFGTLFSEVIADDFDLAGQDIGKNFDDMVSRERLAMPKEVLPDGGVDVAAHVFLCLLTVGCHERVWSGRRRRWRLRSRARS